MRAFSTILLGLSFAASAGCQSCHCHRLLSISVTRTCAAPHRCLVQPVGTLPAETSQPQAPEDNSADQPVVLPLESAQWGQAGKQTANANAAQQQDHSSRRIPSVIAPVSESLAPAPISDVQVTAMEPVPVVAEIQEPSQESSRKSVPAIQASTNQTVNETKSQENTTPESREFPKLESLEDAIQSNSPEQLPASVDPGSEPMVLQARPVGDGQDAEPTHVATRPDGPESSATGSRDSESNDGASIYQLPSIEGAENQSSDRETEAKPGDGGSRFAAFRDLPSRSSLAPPADLPLTDAQSSPRTAPANIVTTERPYYLPPQQILRLKAVTPIDQPTAQPNRASILMRDTVVLDGTHLLTEPEQASDPQSQPARIPSIDHQQLREALKRLSPSPENGPVQR